MNVRSEIDQAKAKYDTAAISSNKETPNREYQVWGDTTGLIPLKTGGSGIIVNNEIGFLSSKIDGKRGALLITFLAKFDDPITVIDTKGSRSTVGKQVKRGAFKTSAIEHRGYKALVYSNASGVSVCVRNRKVHGFFIREVASDLLSLELKDEVASQDIEA